MAEESNVVRLCAVVEIIPLQGNEQRRFVVEIYSIGLNKKIHKRLVFDNVYTDIRKYPLCVFVKTLVNSLFCDQVVNIFRPPSSFFQNLFVGDMMQDIFISKLAFLNWASFSRSIPLL